MREPIRLLNKDVGKPAQVTLTQESREYQKQRENVQIRKPYIIKEYKTYFVFQPRWYFDQYCQPLSSIKSVFLDCTHVIRPPCWCQNNSKINEAHVLHNKKSQIPKRLFRYCSFYSTNISAVTSGAFKEHQV